MPEKLTLNTESSETLRVAESLQKTAGGTAIKGILLKLPDVSRPKKTVGGTKWTSFDVVDRLPLNPSTREILDKL